MRESFGQDGGFAEARMEHAVGGKTERKMIGYEEGGQRSVVPRGVFRCVGEAMRAYETS